MTKMLSLGLVDLKQKVLRVIIAAIVASGVLEIMMRVGAPNLMGIPPMNPADLVTSILGLPEGHLFGSAVHLCLALIIFPIGYVLVAYRNFPGPYVLKGAIWGVLLWLVAMAVVVPLAGLPVFFGFGMPMVAALIAHIVYGIILAAIIGKPK